MYLIALANKLKPQLLLDPYVRYTTFQRVKQLVKCCILYISHLTLNPMQSLNTFFQLYNQTLLHKSTFTSLFTQFESLE